MARKIIKAANKVSKAFGAAPLVNYTSSKIAKAIAKPAVKKYVADTTTARQARNSGIALAANIASLASGGAAAGVIRAAKNAKRAAKLATIIPKKVYIPGQKAPLVINNWGNAKQTPIIYRKAKLTIKRYK